MARYLQVKQRSQTCLASLLSTMIHMLLLDLITMLSAHPWSLAWLSTRYSLDKGWVSESTGRYS